MPKIQRSQFKPPWWLSNPHLQTILPNLFSRNTGVATIRERLVLDDGDFIDLDWTAPCDGPIVLVLHGLGGSVKSNYVQGVLKEITDRGWQAVVFNFRGCSGVPNLTARSYHIGETGDLANIVKLIKQRFPTRSLLAVGYSLGGNVLLKWLGECGATAPLDAAVAVSVPFNIHRTVKTLNRGLSRIYQWWFMRGLYRTIQDKAQIVDLPEMHRDVKTTMSIEDYDRLIGAPLNGITTLEEYYAYSSCLGYLKNITVDTLIMYAEDDPLIDEPYVLDDIDMPDNIMVEISETGGHIGYISGQKPWRPTYYLEKRVPLYLEEQLAKQA